MTPHARIKNNRIACNTHLAEHRSEETLRPRPCQRRLARGKHVSSHIEGHYTVQHLRGHDQKWALSGLLLQQPPITTTAGAKNRKK